MRKLDIKIENKDNITIVYLSGILETFNTGKLDQVFGDLIEDKKHIIIINLENLEYISSTGIGVFVGTLSKLREVDGKLCFCCFQSLFMICSISIYEHVKPFT